MAGTQALWERLQGQPSLTELAEAYPDDWAEVRTELAGVFERRQAGELKALAERAGVRAAPNAQFLSGERDGRAFEAFVRQQLRLRMTELAIRQYAFSAATGVVQGKVRFNLFNGLIAQRLLFKHALERKPVSLRWFRLLWPLVWQKRLLMPLVEKRGIYCFYSRELIAALAGLAGARRCVEIAAGDGTLSRFLRERGVDIVATDDHSWQAQVSYPDDVRRLDARDALRSLSPEVVLCSWPPANNSFERQVFRTQSVQRYIVIGSRSRFITGNWADYLAQIGFSMRDDAALGKLVVPPELDAAVLVFERVQAAG